MDVKILDNLSLVSLSACYNKDDNVKFRKLTKHSYNGITVTLNDCFSATKDTSINKYSTFFLSDSFSYDNFLTIDRLTLPKNFVFTSYIAANSLSELTTNSLYLSSIPNGKNGFTSLKFTNTLNENSYFEIYFINDNQCKIKNTEETLTRYLTYDYLTSSLVMLTGTDIVSDSDLNTFNYVYDKKSNLIYFYKKIFEKTQALTFDVVNNLLTLQPTLTSSSYRPFKNNQLFRLRNNVTTLNDKLSTSNYVYKKSLNKSKLLVDEQKSVYNFNSNFLINSEYYNIDSYKLKMDLSLLNLKNQKTTSNTQSQGGLFLNEQKFKHRYYENLFTGVNQETGNQYIGLGYSSYTTSKKLLRDAITYFHIPLDIYPYNQLNINDSSLIESGAISSNTPYYSDKVFKKLNDYKYSSPYGDVTNTQTNAFLCTWLSGGDNMNDKGVWVDRYYNPTNLSYYEGLTNPSTGLTTDFDTISSLTNNNNKKYDLYDVKSNLTFDPGALYAYHHVGNNNCQSFVDSLSTSLIYNNIKYYFNKYNERKSVVDELVLNYDNFTKVLDQPLDLVSKFDSFNINFDLYSNDWNSVMGSQLFGNYNTNGFGIFNYRKITPFTLYFNNNLIYIFNTKGQLLKTITNDETVVDIIKFEPNGIFLVIDNKGYITKYNYIGTALEKQYYTEIDNNNKNHYYGYDNYLFVLSGENWYRINSNSMIIESEVNLNYNVKRVGDVFDSILVDKNNVYLLSGYNCKKYNDEIYFYNEPNLFYYNTKTNNINLKAEVLLQDYAIDNNFNFYVLHDENNLSIIDKFDNLTFNDKLSTLIGYDVKGVNIDIIDEFYNNQKTDDTLSIISLSSTNLVYSNLKNGILSSFSTVNQLGISSETINYNINNYDYLRNNFDNGETLKFYVKLPNIYDVQTYEIATLNYSLSNLSPGYHNFNVTFDTINGIFNLIIDGDLESSYLFDKSKYSFGTIFDKNLYIGTEIGYNNDKLSDVLDDVNYYNYGNYKIKNLFIHNINLDYYQIVNYVRLKSKIDDVIFQLPTGKRSYTENIFQVFKNRLPGRMSNYINIAIRDSSITEKDIQYVMQKDIESSLDKIIPAGTTVNKITWEEEYD